MYFYGVIFDFPIYFFLASKVFSYVQDKYVIMI